jgi:hypothetical protein
MTFQPFHTPSFFDYCLNAILWATGFTGAVVVVTLILCLITREKETGKALRIMSIFSFVVVAYISCAVLTIDNANNNRQIALHNVSQKYIVESLTYEKGYRGAEPYADTASPLNVTVKSNGKSQLAVITQNMQTFEPSLTDIDTGKPLDELLRK